MADVARETGVSYATIANWKEKYLVGKLDVDDATGATPDQRNPGEKLMLLLASKTLDEEQKGEWLRQPGLHSEHLPLWEQELTAAMNDKQTDLNQKNGELKRENKRLQRELERKEKALAKPAVLLTPKKSSAICLRPRTRRPEQRGGSSRDPQLHCGCERTRGQRTYDVCIPGDHPQECAKLA